MELILLLIILAIPYIVLGLIVLLKARRSESLKSYDYRPTVTVYVPTYNEEKHIARKLDNLFSQTYPIKEILILDCSTDKTVRIIEEYQKKFPSTITLVKQPQRIGMAKTLNEAFKHATGEIFVKTDCDSISRSNALAELIANFADEKVGGATGICIAEKGVEKYFRKFMTAIQVAESNIDSTLIAHSPSLLAFRTSLVEPVKPNSVADDTEEFLLVRKQGFKTIIDPSVISQEEVPADHAVRRMQKNRRSQGIVKVLLENFDMILNPKYRLYGAVVLPMEWFILIISPILLIAFGGIAAYALYLINPLIAAAMIAIVAAAVIQRSNMLFAIIDTELSGLVGFFRSIVVGNGDGLWQKVR
jgi:cellulose synthase/poly-beta-1,6-N-acetylglucosamine synthase-like glycosyltransferase